MFVILFIFYCLGNDRCDLRLCSINSQNNLIESINIDLDQFAYTFWYKYQTLVEGDFDFSIFEQQSTELTQAQFSFKISLRNQIAIHEFIILNRTNWDQQLITPISQDKDFWHFFIMYYESDQFHIKIITRQSDHNGINTQPLRFQRMIINKNLFYPQVKIHICGEKYEPILDIKSLKKSEIQTCKDSIRQTLGLEYSPDFKRFLSRQFNSRNAIITVLLRDSQQSSSFNITLFFALIDLQQDPIIQSLLQNSDIQTDQLNHTQLTISKLNQLFKFQHPEIQSSILSLTIPIEELSKWYFIKLEPEKLEIQTFNNIYNMNYSQRIDSPNTQVMIQVNNTIFSQLLISASPRQNCSPNCLKCSDPFTCLQCKGNRIFYNCNCPVDTQDFGGDNCEYMHLRLELNQIDKEDKNCPIGYVQCGEIAICDKGYAKYNNNCYKCPQLGNEICQQCLTSSEIKQPFLCQYLSDENLKRYMQGEIDDTMFFLYQDIYDDQPYQTLKLASIQIVYQIYDDQGFKAIKYEHQHDIRELVTQKPLCPYRYDIIRGFNFCQKIPKNCLKVQFFWFSDRQICQFCQQEYSLIGDQCVKCPQNCQSCTQSQCTSCIDGFYLSYNGICKLCSIPSCKVCYEQSLDYLSIEDNMVPYSIDKQPNLYCAICNHGYEFNYKTRQCQPSQQTCEIAIYDQKSICLVGSEGQFITSSCILQNCDLCFKNSCVRCAIGYYPQDSKCKECRFQYSFNSDKTYRLDCKLHDPINYSDYKQSLQHIYLLHQNKLHTQLATQIQLSACINGEVLYDIAKCQSPNNIRHQQNSLCYSYIQLSQGKVYCTEVNQNLNGIVIDRVSGQAKYCNQYLICDISKQYNLILNIYGQIEYKDMVFHNLDQFIQSLDEMVIQEHSITSLDLHLTLQIQKQQNFRTKSQIPLNLYIYLSPQISQYLYPSRSAFLTLGYFKNIYFDKVDYFYQSIIFDCETLHIKKYFLSDLQGVQDVLNINLRTYFLKADKIIIDKIIVTNTSRMIDMVSLNPINIQIKFLSYTYCNLVNSTFRIFQPFQNFSTLIKIDEFFILQSTIINTILFADPFQVVAIEIDQLTIQQYEMRDSDLITAKNITIDKITIYNSTFTNSTLFHSPHIHLRQLEIVNCTFIDSDLIHHKNLINHQFQYVFDSIELTKIFSQRSSIIDFDGQVFIINKIQISNLTIQAHKLVHGFIQVASMSCQIHNLELYDTALNLMTLLNVLSKHILIQNIIISSTQLKKFATLRDQQVLVPNDNFASYIILSNFITLNITTAYFGQFYIRAPIIRINSIYSTNVFLYEITFDKLQVFSSKIIEIYVNEIIVNRTVFKNIWFHSINLGSSQQDVLFQCIGTNVFINQLAFQYIKNTKSDYLSWLFVEGNIVKLRKVRLDNFKTSIGKYFLDGSNINDIELFSQQSGNTLMLNIITESLSLESFKIASDESQNHFLVRLYYYKVIDKLDIEMINITIYENAKYRGIIYCNQSINYVRVHNLTSKYLEVQDVILNLKVNDLLIFYDMSLKFQSGGLLSCQSIDLTKITLKNISILSLPKPLNESQLGRVLIDIYGGIIRIEEFSINNCISDVLHLKSFQQLNISQLHITKAYAMSNLIFIESQICLYLMISDIFINNHQSQPQNIVSNQKLQMKNLIQFKLKSMNQCIISNIVLNNNQDISTLILFIGDSYFIINNLQIINNICQLTCLMDTDKQHIFQQDRIIQTSQSNPLNIIDGIIIGNSGIFIDFIIRQIQLQRILLVHKGMIFNQVTQNQIIQSIQESQLLYHSDHIIDLTSVQLNNTFVMNEQFQNIHSINKIVLTLSFDDGNTQYLTEHDTVIFYKTQTTVKKYCYFPTGQSLGQYQRLNLQTYSYDTFIKEMKFGLRGRSSSTDLECVLSYLNKQYPFRLNQQNWKDFTLISEPKSMVTFQVQCTKYHLQFLVKVLNCQLGEIYLNSSCLRCDSSRNQYSVKKNSVQCLTITEEIEQVQSGIIKLKSGYWRPFLTNSQIEQCPKQQVCLGGWQVGDNSCLPGYLGALCAVCDIYSQRGHGNYVQNSWNECELCQTRYSIILYICIILVIQIVLLYFNNKSWETDCIQFRNNTLLCKHYRILAKFYVDHTQVTIKLFTNFLQQFLVITSTCQLGLPVFLKQVFYQYSNPSISIWQQLQCFYANEVSLSSIIQAKPLIIIVVSMVVFNIYLFTHLVMISKKIFKYLSRDLCVTFYYLIIFHYTNYYEILITLTSWRRISGLRWVNTNISINYDQNQYIQHLFIFILPQIALFWILPIIVLKILNIKQTQLLKLKTYYYWGFLYKQFKLDSYNEEIFLTWMKLTVLSISYQLSNHALYRLSALLLVIGLYKRFQERHAPYQFQNFNRLNLNLYDTLSVLVVLFALISDETNNSYITINIYIIIGITLLIIFKLITLQLFNSIQHTYQSQIDDVKMIISKKLPNLQNRFPTLFKSSSIRLRYVRAKFDKMRPKNLQLSRSKSLIKQSQIGIEDCSKSKSITAADSPDIRGYPMLELNVPVRLETSIIF